MIATGSAPTPLALRDATIYLPTRRAARTFGDAFARVLGGAALLPQFKALGDVDEDEFLFDAERRRSGTPAGHRADPPQAAAGDDGSAMAPASRGRAKSDLAQAAALADGLAALMDEVETQGARLGDLETVVPGGAGRALVGSERISSTLLHTEWPRILDGEGTLNPADTAQPGRSRRWQSGFEPNPSKGPVIAAGSTGSIPATAELLRVIADLPNGAVVLPGLDRDLDEASWNELDPGHPQFGLKQLLQRIGVAARRREGLERGARWRARARAARGAASGADHRCLARHCRTRRDERNRQRA